MRKKKGPLCLMITASNIKLQNRICRMSWKRSEESDVYDVLYSGVKVLQVTQALEMVIWNMQLQLYERILGRMESFSNLDARVQASLFL